MNTRLFSFVGGTTGTWRVLGVTTLIGDPLAGIQRLDLVAGAVPQPESASWVLRGVTSNERYVTRAEKDQLVARQPALGRAEATHAALIPLRKTASWWALTQDERRRIFEDGSRHIATGMRYLPAIARRLHHCRDVGGHEPFDFLTWFEYAPADAAAFDALLAELRASEEWQYIDREIDIRLVRDGSA
jgi:chlorite dismutase